MNFSNLSAHKVPDFNYPQNVSTSALADLKTAEKQGNKANLCDAIIRYVMAQSVISNDNAQACINKIEEYRQKESSVDYSAILALLEADIYNNLSKQAKNQYAEVHASFPSDISEWNTNDFTKKLQELYDAIFSDIDRLRNYDITAYKSFITCDVKYFPTLLDFSFSKRLQANIATDNKDDLLQHWASYHTGEIAPSIYISILSSQELCNSNTSENVFKKLYNQYSHFEESGLILEEFNADMNNYDTFKEYLQKFPKSYFAPAITNKIYQIETKNINIAFPESNSCTSKIPVTLSLQNINDYRLNVYTYNEASKNNKLGKLIKTYNFHYDSITPFRKDEITQQLNPLPYGEYTIVPSFIVDGEEKTYDATYHNTITISDISAFTLSTINGNYVYVVNSITGKPMSGVNVFAKTHNSYAEELLGKTDNEGKMKLPNKRNNNYHKLHFTLGKDSYSTLHYPYTSLSKNDKTNYYAKVITDLAVYRPGETVKYSAIVFAKKGNINSPAKGEKLAVTFCDSNYKDIATDTIQTNDMGKISGEFVVPTDRMNGSFCIIIKNDRINTRQYINVSEYKTPQFFISLNDTLRSYNTNEDIIIKGTAQTYAGMPVANADIIANLSRSPWFFWANYDDDDIMQDTIRTNANGEFSITLSRNLFDENDKSKREKIANIYKLELRCTNNTGETQECSHHFFVGSHRRVSFTGKLDFINNAPITLPVAIESSDDNDKNFSCNYQILTIDKDSTIVAKGSFNSQSPKIDLTALASGTYTIKVEDASGLAEKASAPITIYRETDKNCPINSILWVPECGRKAGNDNIAHITIGTTEPEIYLFYSLADSKDEKSGWLHLRKGLHKIDFPMPTGENEVMTISLTTMRNGEQKTEKFTMISPKREVKGKIEILSFRDRIVPGTKEKWTFRFVDNHGNSLKGAAILALTDKAINSIAQNLWYDYAPQFHNQPSAYLTPTNNSGLSYSYATWTRKFIKENNANITQPQFNFYGIEPFLILRYQHVLAFGTMLRSNKMAAPTADAEGCSADSGLALEECVVTKSANSIQNLDNIQLRESDVKTALWQPNIVIDENGYYAVEFDVPNFNTTWIMQTLAYTANGLCGGIQQDVVSSKPLMVKANMPRFLRSGDKTSLAASIANKSDKSVDFSGTIELFDPRTNNVIAKHNINGTLKSMCNTSASIECVVPTDADFIGFRIKAASNGCGDGEQVMVPIFSNISPVTEALPFFIDANSSTFNSTLPTMANASKATLEYCDNPVWYCATALPTMFDESAITSIGLSHSLFALSIAQGLAKQNPQIADAIEYWQKHDNKNNPLTSALSHNSDLKIGTLLASPWINEADRQTLRMSKLNELFSGSYCTENIDKIVSKLQELQMPDGGFSWIRCEHSKSSLFCTGTVLEIIARIRHLGYSIDNATITEMERKAIGYLDAEYLKLFNDKKKCGKMINYSGYAYVRTMYSDITIPAENRRYIKQIIGEMKPGWKNRSIAEKAFFALTLNNNNERKTAKQITESIRQFSINTPERGMYWDAIDNNWWRGSDRLATTTIILQALNEVDNRTDEINQIRKWILLNKQSNDWGSSSLASEAVYTILSTGSKWLTKGMPANIAIGGKEIKLCGIDSILGYSRKDIDINDIMGKDITINRRQNTSPAWGAIYLQGKSVNTTIKSAKTDDLSIDKTILVYGADGKLTKADKLKVGDKVRVQCTIKCGKTFEYVTLTDERGACFEPVDKLSGFDMINSVWMYRETKDSQTNIFIPSIDKGTYVIGYDMYVTNPGSFSIGIASIQCQYAPQEVAHSSGSSVSVQP